MKLNVKIDDTSFEVEIRDLNARPVIALVDGQCFEVFPETANNIQVPVVQPSPSIPAAPVAPVAVRAVPTPVTTPAAPTASAKVILAPLPGVILSVSVSVGTTVTVGQELLVLEAMKMKNAIRATRPGKVTAIHVANGDHVKHGQLLVEFEA
jgi:biotin carboxyl carrier protein